MKCLFLFSCVSFLALGCGQSKFGGKSADSKPKSPEKQVVVPQPVCDKTSELGIDDMEEIPFEKSQDGNDSPTSKNGFVGNVEYSFKFKNLKKETLETYDFAIEYKQHSKDFFNIKYEVLTQANEENCAHFDVILKASYDYEGKIGMKESDVVLYEEQHIVFDIVHKKEETTIIRGVNGDFYHYKLDSSYFSSLKPGEYPEPTYFCTGVQAFPCE